MKNSRNKFATLFLLFSMAGMAQVGVGTPTPAATLDITAANLTGSTVDGLLIPRVTRQRAEDMAGTPTSTLIYVTNTTVTTAVRTINVTAAGFYFFNGTVWERLGSGTTNAWNVTGNSGLLGTTNFLGTTDDVDLAFRRNNVAAGKIGTTSTSFGVNALTAGVATNNAAFGTNALALSTGADNVAVGNGTLSANTGGLQNTGIGNAALRLSTGSANTAVGFEALTANTTASNNSAFGFRALYRNTAANNTGLGFQALTNNTVGGSNTGLGHMALAANTTGSGNTAVGFQASVANISGGENTTMGFQAANGSTSSRNTVMGYQALFFNISGTNNTAIGRHALHNSTSSNNTAVGQQALLSNAGAAGNTAVGSDALRVSTGAGSTAVGWAAGEEHGAGINNTYIGSEAGRYSTGTTNNNSFFGWQSGYRNIGNSNTALGSNTLKFNAVSSNNVAIGYNALTASQAGNNTAVGYNSLLASTAANNTAVGFGTLSGNTVGTGNVALGYNAGSLETGSNKLYIENSNAGQDGALIYGEFDNNIARVNGTLQINNPANVNGYALPNLRGTAGQLLQTNGAGLTTWVSPGAIAITETDPQVSSVTNNAVPRWNAATTTLLDGVIRDDATNVGIGIPPSAGNRLDVAGKTRTTNFQMTTAPANGYILQSDVDGNGSWVQNPINTLSLVRANMTGNQVLVGGGWEKLNFNGEAFDTGNEFNITNGRFRASKAGFYRIDAALHTNIQNNNNAFSIGIYVNGALYQETSSDHVGFGIAERAVTCIVQLAPSDYVEVYVENFVNGAEIDGYSGKTIFEVQQIR